MNCFQNTNFSEDSQAAHCPERDFPVVNCFQNTNFSEDSQANVAAGESGIGCELLSEY